MCYYAISITGDQFNFYYTLKECSYKMARKIITILLIISILSMVSCMQEDFSDTSTQSLFNTQESKFADDILDQGPNNGGSITLFSKNPDTLNPLLTKNVNVKDITGLIFEGLVKLDKNQLPIPCLADSWIASTNGLEWTFILKDGIEWHNGEPLTAYDIEFTIGIISNPNIESIYKKNVSNIEKYKVEDKRTIKLYLKQVNAFTPEYMTFPIISKNYYFGKEIFDLKSKKNMEPVGTGMYKYLSGEGVLKLEKNQNWWDKEKEVNDEKVELPNIDQINVRYYKNDTDKINAFWRKEIDVTHVDISESNKYSTRSDTLLKKYISNEFVYITINNKRGIYQNKMLRQALSYSINRQEIVNTVIPGEAVITDLPVIPGTWIDDDNENILKFSKEKAIELFSQAGWVNKNGKMYSYLNGKLIYAEIVLEINNDNVVKKAIAENIKKQLNSLGIAVSIVEQKWDVFTNDLKSKNYSLALVSSKVPGMPDLSQMYSKDAKIGNYNIAGFENDEVEKYLTQIRSLDNLKDRKQAYARLKYIILDEMPYIGLFFFNNAIIYNKRVRGKISPFMWERYDLLNWYVPDGYRKNSE